MQILRLIPGPRAFPVIGAQWQWFFGRYKYNKYHEANEEKFAKYGAVVREEVIWNFPLVHLFDVKVSSAMSCVLITLSEFWHLCKYINILVTSFAHLPAGGAGAFGA